MTMNLTRTALAAELGISAAMVSRLSKAGMPTHDVAAARAWRTANVRARVNAASRAPTDRPMSAAGGTDALAGEGYQAARLRREIAEADLAWMRREREAGALVLADDVRAALARRCSSTRERLLSMTARLAPVLAAEHDPVRVGQLLDDEVHAALAELAGYDPADTAARVAGG